MTETTQTWIPELNLKKFISALAVLLLSLSAAKGMAGSEAPELDLQQYEGKVVVLDFWASWCVPCRRSFPWLNSMHSRYEDLGLVIIGVNLDNTREQADAFLARYPASFTIHFDSSKTLARNFGVEAMPSSFVIGRDGEIVARHLGFKVKRQHEYEAVLIEALGVSE